MLEIENVEKNSKTLFIKYLEAIVVQIQTV